ncbi:hypothetical protein HUT16_08250 [Kitasatospora sp. NA04385]|uniref:hypothetical protein n=1 Tax=Kitasatospora sp. NA04385 TaxID=2742135 RepID=UPI0015906BFA|nr:hypothetical protein [Kitasatospora sp. NA04385]QKW19055.1 hypothetical protein HUT16_08250 [Kitasatospora sp. NA04385]
MPSSRRSKLTSLALATAIAASGAVATTALTVATATIAQAASSVGGQITRSEVLSRANDWYNRNIPYDQTATATDVGGRSYRSDCSGFVSMAWHLGSSENTDSLDVRSLTSRVALTDLQPGDALDNDPGDGYIPSTGHIVLFDHWVNKAAGTFAYIAEANTADDMQKGTGTVGSGTFANYFGLRYNRIVDDAPSGLAPQSGQITSVMINGVGHVFQVTSDGRIRIDDGHYPSGGWDGWKSLDGSLVASLTAAAEGSRVHLFAVMQDGTLRETIGDYSTGSWGGWHTIPGSLVVDMDAVTVAGKIRLYAVLQNGAPRSADLDPVTDTFSTGWYDLTGGNVKQLVGTAVGDTVRLFAVTNDGLLHENDGDYAAGVWSGWNIIDGSQVKKLAAATTTGGAVHLYAVTNDGLLHSTDGNAMGSWNGWASRSGSLVDQLDALGSGQNVYLYAHTTDGLTHSQDVYYSNSTWGGWYNL